MKTGQNGETERSWNMREENGKDNTGKNSCTTWGNKPEGSGERRETKEISTKNQNNTDKTGHSKTMKENSINNWEGMAQKHINNQTPKKPSNLGRKYDNRESIRKRLNGLTIWLES